MMKRVVESSLRSPPGAAMAASAGLLVALLACAPNAAIGAEPTMLFENAAPGDVLDALYAECYDAGLLAEPAGDGIIVCSADLSGGETSAEGVPFVGVHDGRARHRIRFAVAERDGAVRAWAYPWIEIEEADGTVLDNEIVSEEYLRRVEDVLADLAASLAAGRGRDADGGPSGWRQYYDSRDDWRLDAHLKAVAHCDARLADLTEERLESQLEAAGVRPFGRTLRDRCEELYEEVFRWGLARGLEMPTVEGYVEYRQGLPPAQRRCAGRLALTADCR
ncbi:MAG: hypothetical protein JXB36_07375 [Gammaproteobacteria bacterium]|nr:hypothetical protein [Gammaproteobacteria bacterium]